MNSSRYQQESSILRRIVAAGIDFVIVFTLGLIGILFLPKGGMSLEELSSSISNSRNSGVSDPLYGQIWITFFGINLAYYLSEVFSGATIGKMISGISIRSVSGDRASLKALGLRYCLKHSPGLLSVAGIITAWSLLNDFEPLVHAIVIFAFLVAIVTKHHMAGYDIVSGTNVFFRRCDSSKFE